MKVQIGDKMLTYRMVHVPEAAYTGQTFLEAAGFHPTRDYLLFRMLANGLPQEVRPDQGLHLRGDGSDRLLTFQNDRSFRLELDERILEWGAPTISGLVLEKLAAVDPATHQVFLEVAAGPDRLIRQHEEVDLTAPGVEALYTLAKVVHIIVNGRPREVDKSKLSFREIVLLAFPNATFAENTVNSVLFKRGPTKHPEGSLVDGDIIRIRNQEIFNVSCTDKS